MAFLELYMRFKMKSREHKEIYIIGGGASGYFAAINTAINFPEHTYTILEATGSCLSKVKVSGGGRCNVTNSCFDPKLLVQNYPRGAKELRGAFHKFQPQDLIEWFHKRNIKLKTEADGRIFPESNSSQTIIDCLLDETKKLGITIKKNCKVTSISKSEEKFHLIINEKTTIKADNILLATGGGHSGHKLASDLGHSIEAPVPSLFTLSIKDSL